MIGSRIKKLRESRRYSQEYMAEKLKITQAAYSKLESDQTNLSIDRLKEIALLLDIPDSELLNSDNNTFHFNENQTANAYAINQTIYNQNLELLEKTITILEKENEHLRNSNETLLRIVEQNKKV